MKIKYEEEIEYSYIIDQSGNIGSVMEKGQTFSTLFYCGFLKKLS